jgi:hypothetical protein
MAKKSYKEEYTPMRPQEEQPQTTQTAPEQPQEIVSPYAMHMQELGSIGAQQEALQAKHDARQANINDLQKRLNEAKANQMSVFSALVDKQKPVYDEKKEKRMRNRAMIQAFGDILAEASKGYFAYNKKGAGVVPKSTPSNALEEVNKISEMQKKYLDEKKAWDTLNMDWQAKKAQADIDAAEALLAKEEKYQDEIEDRIEKLRERGVKITDDIRDARAEQENDRNHELWLRENKLGRYAPSKSGYSYRSYVKDKEKADNDKIKIWADVHGEDPKDYYESEKSRIIEDFDNDIPTQVYVGLLNEGLSRGEAMQLLERFDNNEEMLSDILEEWENGNGSLANAIRNYRVDPNKILETFGFKSYIK